MIALAMIGAARATRFQAQALVNEKGPQTVALGYVFGYVRVDVKKFPKFGADQHCANCALYQGKATDNTARLHAVARRAGGGSRVVQRLGEDGVNTLAGHEASR